ncbi:collagen-like triple helix repeat-containing protein [Nonomuraea sp. ZG12]|uniref:collagen-like triple helix repeat-containing protein n=1 Tax=Nonomuraea sp. ZG12 TaxID=3452207 RepID=UPI003F894781
MNRGWIVGGALVLVAAPAVPAAAAGVTMVLDRVDDSAGLRTGVSAGDVLRYRVRFDGTAPDARLAVATTPVHALTTLTCSSPSRVKQPANGTDPQTLTTRQPLASQGPPAAEPLVSQGAAEPTASEGAVERDGSASVMPSSGLGADAAPASGEGISAGSSDGVSAASALAARTLADMETSGSSTAVVAGARACVLGELSGRRAVDVVLTVPEGAGEVALAAVARVRLGGGKGLTTMTEATGVPVRGAEPDDAPAFGGEAVRVDPEARADKRQTVRQREAKTVTRARRQTREPGTAEAPQQPEVPGSTEVAEQPWTSATAEGSTNQGEPGQAGIVRQSGKPGRAGIAGPSGKPGRAGIAGKPGRAGVVGQQGKPGRAEGVGELKKADVPQGREVGAPEGVRPGLEAGGVRPGLEAGGVRPGLEAGGVRPGLEAEGVRPGLGAEGVEVGGGVGRGGVPVGGTEVGVGGGLWREPALRAAPEGKGENAAELPPAALPTASASPSVTGVSMDAPGAPLPRAVAAPQVRLQAAEVVNPLAGGRGLSAAAGGIAVLMAGLWAISKAHRGRTRRKVL